MPRFCAPLLTLLVALSLTACDEVPDLSLPNEPPQAVDDDVDLLQDFIANVEIAANDTDVDGNIELIEIIADPEHGDATVTGASVRYIPDRLFVGTDSFAYRITDTKGESDEATVTITVKRRQTRGLFTADVAGIDRLYMIDSRQPDTVTELSVALPATESVRDWAYDTFDQEAVVLTDADRIVIIPLSDPAMMEAFPIDLQAGETVDGGFDISPFARRAVFSINNRIVRTFNLDDATFQSFDTGWTDGTMTVDSLPPIGTQVVMAGTLGTPAVTALYLVPTDGSAPVQLFEGADATETVRTRRLFGTNQMVWLREQPGMTGTGPFSCQNPPAQRLSNLSYVSVLDSANMVDLNATSGLLPAMTDIISYNPGATGSRVFVAACPPAADIVQLIEIPYGAPATARVIATGTDASDGLYTVNVAQDSFSLIYVVDGDTGLRSVLVDVSNGGLVETDLTAAVPGYQTFTDGMDVRAPASAISTDRRRWLFIAPDNGEPKLLTWLELQPDDLTSAATTLPFATTRAPLSDGYVAFVNDGTRAALVRLDGTPATAVALPGALADADGALGVAPVVFAPVALADTP